MGYVRISFDEIGKLKVKVHCKTQTLELQIEASQTPANGF